MKRILSLLLAAVICLTALPANISSPVFADTASVMSVIRDSSKSILVLDGGTATLKSTFVATASISKITAIQTLEKFWGLWIWNQYTSFTKTVTTQALSMTNKKTDLTTGTYRLKTEFIVYLKDGTSESFVLYSDQVTM